MILGTRPYMALEILRDYNQYLQGNQDDMVGYDR